MEINITKFIKAHGHEMELYSNSVARSGLQNIGQITWQNAVEAMDRDEDKLVPNTADLAALREHFSEYGAWDEEELMAMGSVELNALLLQFISGDYQEYTEAKERGRKAFKEWDENCGGHLYRDSKKRQWWYHIGC